VEEPLGRTVRSPYGINGSIPGTGGYDDHTHNGLRVIRSQNPRGAALSPGINGIIPGPGGLTSTPGTD